MILLEIFVTNLLTSKDMVPDRSSTHVYVKICIASGHTHQAISSKIIQQIE